VFQNPKYLQNSFTIVFPRKPSIRRDVFEFEEKLKNSYIQPSQIISVPDEINPDMPRMIFTSIHGYSQILVSQLNFVLNINYSPDWQNDIAKGKEYILSKVSILYELLDIIEENCPCFCGFNTLVQIPAQEEDDETVISHIYNLFSKHGELSSSDIYEFQLKTSQIVEQDFFSNITIQNYRNWNIDIGSEGVQREGILKLSSKGIIESGIQIAGDFNDRYAFNESDGYCSLQNQAIKIIDLGLDEVNKTIKKIIEVK
jgi:hypothetical protein